MEGGGGGGKGWSVPAASALGLPPQPLAGLRRPRGSPCSQQACREPTLIRPPLPLPGVADRASSTANAAAHESSPSHPPRGVVVTIFLSANGLRVGFSSLAQADRPACGRHCRPGARGLSPWYCTALAVGGCVALQSPHAHCWAIPSCVPGALKRKTSIRIQRVGNEPPCAVGARDEGGGRQTSSGDAWRGA